MGHIFISHASADDAFVDRLAEDLHSHKLTTWVDHADIPPGRDWDAEVESAINACELLMFIVTEASLKSGNCTDEWSHALDINKLIIPVMLEEGLANEDMPFRLKRRQWVDFRGKYENAFGDLINWLGLEGKTAVLAPPIEIDEERDISTARMDRNALLPLLEWVNIPGGEVRLDHKDRETRHRVANFRIARYPVTVQQYNYFIRDGGYQNRDFWTILGWNWKTESKIQEPLFWGEAPLHNDKHPVVGVSWYEAIAFCKWLSQQLSITITLPTELQWQRAAQGGEDRHYPWGDEFKPHANTNEMDLGATTPVDRFNGGQSLFRVYDMSGNVWEWCLNEWQQYGLGSVGLESEDERAVRGGSWSDSANAARIKERRSFVRPFAQGNNIGFRIVTDAV